MQKLVYVDVSNGSLQKSQINLMRSVYDYATDDELEPSKQYYKSALSLDAFNGLLRDGWTVKKIVPGTSAHCAFVLLER